MSAEDLLFVNGVGSKNLERTRCFGSFKVNLKNLYDKVVAANPLVDGKFRLHK